MTKPAAVPAGRPSRFTAVVGTTTHQVEVVPLGDGRFEVSIDDRTRVVDSQETGAGTLSLLIDHAIAEVTVVARGEEVAVEVAGRTHRFRLLDERALRQRGGKAVTEGSREVRAVMPGKVVAVLVQVGAEVTIGQGLLVIEAMKMENEIAAVRAGTVQEIRVSAGQAVEAGEILAIVE